MSQNLQLNYVFSQIVGRLSKCHCLERGILLQISLTSLENRFKWMHTHLFSTHFRKLHAQEFCFSFCLLNIKMDLGIWIRD